MPFIPHTPESLLPRSDSKNPAATCRGLTSTGRPCRRAISKSPQPSPSSNLGTPSINGLCWQHKDQASIASPQGLQSSTIHERTSIDTLVDRLDLLEVEKRQRRKAVRKQDQAKASGVENTFRPARPRPNPTSTLGLFCCIGEADDRKRGPRPVKNPQRRKTASVPDLAKLSRPPIARDPSSRTGEFLSLIPSSASPETTSLLLAELAKPISEHDDDGYIYMFWLTSENLPSTPPSEAAPSLLAPPLRQPGQRRISDVLNTFASNMDNSSKKKILLKIGRAQNVQRRLNQWTRQCGYNLSLIRYYPYHPTTLSSTSANDAPITPRKVPNAHKVERLIHIELNGKRAVDSGKCAVCGREHREWFEVEASRNGVKAVDEVVRRWVGWGERAGGS